MISVPWYLSLGFVLTTLLTIGLMYKAGTSSRFLWIILFWMLLQGAVGMTGFYQFTDSLPPRFVLLPLPPLIAIGILFLTRGGKAWIDRLDQGGLTLLHVVRIPVELILYGLFIEKTIPLVMTFAGSNLDIFSGITAPLIYYYGIRKGKMNTSALLIWNFVCLGLLANIVWHAAFSVQTPIQRYGFEQPNRAILGIPFLWLPSVVVPLVLLAHLAAIRQLLHGKREVKA